MQPASFLGGILTRAPPSFTPSPCSALLSQKLPPPPHCSPLLQGIWGPVPPVLCPGWTKTHWFCFSRCKTFLWSSWFWAVQADILQGQCHSDTQSMPATNCPVTSSCEAPLYRQGTQGQRGEVTHSKSPWQVSEGQNWTRVCQGSRSHLCIGVGGFIQVWAPTIGMECHSQAVVLPEDEIAGRLGVQGEPSYTPHHPCDLEPLSSLTGPQSPHW